MEFWLKTSDVAMRLPINPEGFDATYSSNVSTVNIINAGDLNIYGNRKLGIYKLEFLLPSINNKYNFAYPSTIGSDDPYHYTSFFYNWKQNKTPFQYIVTETPVNYCCIIEDFTISENDGTRDVRVSLNLRQYWQPQLKLASESNVADNKPRESTVSTTVYGSNTSSSSTTPTTTTKTPSISTNTPSTKPTAQSGSSKPSENLTGSQIY